MRRSNLAVLAALPLAGLLVFASTAEPEPHRDGAPTRVPVERISLACPELDGADTIATSVVSPMLNEFDTGDLATNPVGITVGKESLGEIEERGQAWAGEQQALTGGLVARADGALAAGLSGGVAGVFENSKGRGVIAGECPPAMSQWWFVGASSSPSRTGRLLLSNAEEAAGVVNLQFLGPDGEIPAPEAAQGVVVPPGKTTALPLDNLVPGSAEVSVGVTTTQGRVIAALQETAQDALDPAGIDFIPASGAPAKSVVLTGLPHKSSHQLTVLNPGPNTSVVQVEVLGDSGAFIPAGKETLEVPATGTATLKLGNEIKRATSGVRLTSEEPIAAAVRTESGSPLADTSFAVSTTPLSTPAVTPVLPGLEGTLVVSGSGRAAVNVTVDRVAAGGEVLGSEDIDLLGGQTATWRIKQPDKTAYLRLTADKPHLAIAAVRWAESDSGGDMSSTVPLRPLRLTIDQPPVTYQPIQP